MFWDRNPALLYGLALFLGCLFTLQTPWALLPFLFLLHKKYVWQVTLLFLLPCCMIYQIYTFPPSGSIVEGTFYPHSIRKNERFGKGWSYSGVLKTEEGRIHCFCFSKNYMPPTAHYKIRGRVRALKGTGYALKVLGPWEFQGSHFSLAGWREQAQSYVKEYIKRHIKQERAALFLTGMVTGQLKDKALQNAFGQLGLSHLMAISGLHFSLLALAFHSLLRLFLPPKIQAVFLSLLLTLYFLFIGDTPSILRAWLMAMVFLLGQIIERRSSALNAIGVALLLSLLWNPLSVATLSFQLSFLATAGILFFYYPCDQMLNHLLSKRPLKTLLNTHWVWQHCYILLSLLREALALTLAVHLTIFPLLLLAFHTFPINSLVYNLFFPFLASLALLFFLISIPLGHWAHVINGYYCDWILRITESPPILFKAFYAEHLPAWLLALFLTALLLIALRLQEKKQPTQT